MPKGQIEGVSPDLLRSYIETCWAVVKNEIARTSDFTMANLVVQLENSFGNISKKTCSGLIKKSREIEDKFWSEDALLDSQK